MKIFWKEFDQLTEQEKATVKETAKACNYTEQDYPDLVLICWENQVQGITNKNGQYFKEKSI
jgi:hypothetical protein